MVPIEANPWAVLSLLAAPAILTNASTILCLATSNRLARAADRARAASASVLASRSPADATTTLQLHDFRLATRRAEMLIEALRRFYLAAGCFAAATCVVLLGALASYFEIHSLDIVARILAIIATIIGVGSLVSGSLVLVAETRVALKVFEHQLVAVNQWQSTHQPPATQPGI